MSSLTNSATPGIRTDLCRALRRTRFDCPPKETARLLLSYTGPGQELVGIRYDGEKAVYFDESNRQVLAVQFDCEGLDKRGGLPIANLSRRVSLERWVMKMEYYWAWKHPDIRKQN